MKNSSKIHTVKTIRPNTRIADYCGAVFPILGSKSATKKAIKAGRVFINGKKAQTADFVRVGDKIEVRGSGVSKIKKLEIDLEIVYEDDFLVVVNKPGGIAVNGNRYKTVENALADLNKKNPQNDALQRPVAVHRLDVPTKGLVVLAKTKTALIRLSKAFQNKKVKKSYIAVVHGQTPEKGKIDQPIQGKKATTLFKRLEFVPSKVFRHLTLVDLNPVTGRTHQLRIHLKDKGHLIVGDKMYAEGQKTILGKGLFLCSYRLGFEHPETGKWLDLTLEIPKRFLRLLEREKKRFS